jgi:hypothetical protein
MHLYLFIYTYTYLHVFMYIYLYTYIYTGWATLESSIIAFQEIVRGYGKLFPIILSNNYNINSSSDNDNNANNDDHNDNNVNNNENNNHDNDNNKDFKNENTSYDLNIIFELLITIASKHLNRYIRESVFNFIRILCDPFIRISGEVYDIKNNDDDDHINGDYYSKDNDDNNYKNINDKVKNKEISAKMPLKNTNLKKKNVYGEILEYDANQSEIIVEALVIGIYTYMYACMYVRIWIVCMYMYCMYAYICKNEYE